MLSEESQDEGDTSSVVPLANPPQVLFSGLVDDWISPFRLAFIVAFLKQIWLLGSCRQLRSGGWLIHGPTRGLTLRRRVFTSRKVRLELEVRLMLSFSRAVSASVSTSCLRLIGGEWAPREVAFPFPVMVWRGPVT